MLIAYCKGTATGGDLLPRSAQNAMSYGDLGERRRSRDVDVAVRCRRMPAQQAALHEYCNNILYVCLPSHPICGFARPSYTLCSTVTGPVCMGLARETRHQEGHRIHHPCYPAQRRPMPISSRRHFCPATNITPRQLRYVKSGRAHHRPSEPQNQACSALQPQQLASLRGFRQRSRGECVHKEKGQEKKRGGGFRRNGKRAREATRRTANGREGFWRAREAAWHVCRRSVASMTCTEDAKSDPPTEKRHREKPPSHPLLWWER